MGIFTRIISAVRGTVRYKLLVLVLFPILLVMPVALAIGVYWGANFTYDQLYIKVNTDLNVAEDVFIRKQQDYLGKLGTLAESYKFRTALEINNNQAIQDQLKEIKASAGFSYLNVIDRGGAHVYAQERQGDRRGRSSSSLLKASQGQPTVGVEIFSEKDLRGESETLANFVELSLIDTPHARPTNRRLEDRAMMIRALYPVKDSRGELIAILDGGVLLNGNFEFVDAIRDLVYGPGSLPEDSIGTVTVFLDDVRISTNVPRKPGERALGTRVSNEVRTQVLDNGETWIDRAFVVNNWYISSYEPIIDVDGKRVGMLYAGFLESPFRDALWKALALLVLMFFVLMLISSLVAIRGAKSIFKPVEVMSNVVQATRDGMSRRIGSVESLDEIGVLANEFDAMLDLLHERNEEIYAAAGQLEHKVNERTTELQIKNEDLQRTIRVLQETRQQLVIAEKLAALGELTAGVAHEINNPTAVILGNMDVLVDELGTEIEPVQHEIDLIIEQVYRIKGIINGLLQYARPDEYAGYMADVDVNELVQQAIQLIPHYQQRSYFEIRLELNADQHIQINQQELKQVVVNLLVNAVHALGAGGGWIRVITRNWNDKGVAISIEDNGVGMDDMAMSRVFNPFYSTREQSEGTGLGLSVSYGLVRRYGGNISVQSLPGEGACFTIWLLTEPELVEDEETIVEQLHAIELDSEMKRLQIS
ncbi:MAG TPA: two-component sensor histidine kinase, partial [Gammaproteobacteria bacterium]|nr:two-component sensor histidine kinase [Gammaproteobacteria bacterium]